MSYRKSLFPALVLIFSMLACGLSDISGLIPSGSVVTPTSALLTDATVVPLLAPAAADTPSDMVLPTATGETSLIPSEMPPAGAAFTVEQLQNAQYTLFGTSDNKTVQLAGGAFQQGTDTSAPDYISVRLGPLVAFGDLNGDGVSDAAVTIAETYGGTGVFVSVAVLLNENGVPLHVASYTLDDRAIINSLLIQGGTVIVDALIHGDADPMCCPSLPVKETFRLLADKLVLTRFVSKTADGQERAINIQNPANGSEVSGTATISGSVTIAPPENNLSYSVFGSGTDPVAQGGLTVNAAAPGGPGTFDLSLDFTSLGISGPVRIEISDLSSTNGSVEALDSIFLTVN
jgi:hypothetical protein